MGETPGSAPWCESDSALGICLIDSMPVVEWQRAQTVTRPELQLQSLNREDDVALLDFIRLTW